jgi:hypothetical protein
MELLSNPKKLHRKLIRCIEHYHSFAFATAWASADTDLFRAIRRNIDRLQHGVIGIHFFQTHPDVLDAFVGSRKVRFMLQPTGTFHPKTAVFWDARGWELFVGSANFTKGGLSTNSELTIRIAGGFEDDRAPATGAANVIAGWFDDAKTMTAERARHYRSTWPARKAALARVAGAYGKSPKRDLLESPVMTYSWDEFVRKVKARAGKKALAERLRLLRQAREAFVQAPSFESMPPEVRMTIAGMPGSGRQGSGWFGNMGPARKFWPALQSHVQHLSDALENIPDGGDVTRREFDDYIENYRRAFPDGGDGIGTATRLLAMKRPDQFVCLDSANRKKLGEDLGIPVSNMSLDRYWDELVERVRDTPWWLSSQPTGGVDLEIWQGRVAMLDALFYEE